MGGEAHLMWLAPFPTPAWRCERCGHEIEPGEGMLVFVEDLLSGREMDSMVHRSSQVCEQLLERV